MDRVRNDFDANKESCIVCTALSIPRHHHRPLRMHTHILFHRQFLAGASHGSVQMWERKVFGLQSFIGRRMKRVILRSANNLFENQKNRYNKAKNSSWSILRIFSSKIQTDCCLWRKRKFWKFPERESQRKKREKLINYLKRTLYKLPSVNLIRQVKVGHNFPIWSTKVQIKLQFCSQVHKISSKA